MSKHERDAGGPTDGKPWVMTYVIDRNEERRNPFHTRDITFRVTNDRDASQEALRLLQQIAARMSVGEFAAVALHPDESSFSADDLYRLKLTYSSPRKLRRVKKPSTCFVRGYGPRQWDDVLNQKSPGAST